MPRIEDVEQVESLKLKSRWEVASGAIDAHALIAHVALIIKLAHQKALIIPALLAPIT